jgi:hypothetical protein
MRHQDGDEIIEGGFELQRQCHLLLLVVGLPGVLDVAYEPPELVGVDLAEVVEIAGRLLLG